MIERKSRTASCVFRSLLYRRPLPARLGRRFQVTASGGRSGINLDAAAWRSKCLVNPPQR